MVWNKYIRFTKYIKKKNNNHNWKWYTTTGTFLISQYYNWDIILLRYYCDNLIKGSQILWNISCLSLSVSVFSEVNTGTFLKSAKYKKP